MALHFDLVDLRLMVNVADTNSMTRGAEQSRISLPAASIRIKNLEEGIGIKLLYRTSQGVTLTPAGHALVQHARTVQGQLEHLRSDLQEYVRGIKGHLRIFANTTTLSEFLPPVLRGYLWQHPDVNVDLRERLSDEIVRAVIEGQTDIGIVAGTVRTENLECLPYRRDRMVLAVPQGHELCEAVAVSFADTLAYDHIGLQESSALHAFLQQASAQMQRQLNLRIQVGNFESACRMAEANIGVAIVPEAAARRHAQTMAIAIVPLSDSWALRSMQICVRDVKALPGFARDLVEMLVADAEAHEASAAAT